MSWVIAGMAAAGLAKAEFIDAPKAERARKTQSEIARYSPWTGMKPSPVAEADPFGSALQFGATGASMKHGMNMDESEMAYNKALTDRLNTGGSMIGGGRDLSKSGPLPEMGDYSSPTVGTLSKASSSKDNPLFPGLKLQSSWWNTPDGQ